MSMITHASQPKAAGSETRMRAKLLSLHGRGRSTRLSLDGVDAARMGLSTITASNPTNLPKKNGGARRDRTDDLMLAKHALSQLSYGPFWVRSAKPKGFCLLASSAGDDIRRLGSRHQARRPVGLAMLRIFGKNRHDRDRTDQRSASPTGRRATARNTSQEWWAWEDSNFRPHAYQARALTN
jgi:hypothetical protein